MENIITKNAFKSQSNQAGEMAQQGFWLLLFASFCFKVWLCSCSYRLGFLYYSLLVALVLNVIES